MAKPFSEGLMGNTVVRRTRPAPVVAPVGGGTIDGHLAPGTYRVAYRETDGLIQSTLSSAPPLAG